MEKSENWVEICIRTFNLKTKMFCACHLQKELQNGICTDWITPGWQTYWPTWRNYPTVAIWVQRAHLHLKGRRRCKFFYWIFSSKNWEQWRNLYLKSQEGNRTAEVRGADEDVQSAIAAIQERFCSGSGGGGGGYRGNSDRGGQGKLRKFFFQTREIN